MGMKPVSWGIVSTARHQPARDPAARRRRTTCDLIAVASRDQARAEEYAREWGIERAYGSYEALLDDPDVEAVYISLPNTLHCEWSIRALEAGKHVLCEKPMSRRAAEVEEAFDAADRTGRLLMEAFMWRHHPQTRKLAELVEGGAIGRPRVIRSSFSFSLSDPTNMRLLHRGRRRGLMDVGCYCVSGSRLLGGEPRHVAGAQVVGPTGVDSSSPARCCFADDVTAHFDCGFVAARARRARGDRRGGLAVPRRPLALRTSR